ncbi:pyridoxamine 5'-phosphate oxidase family protein, partial [Streptomyces sp. NPDC001215]
DEVSAKVRTGGVSDEPEDLALPHWAGVIPVRKEYGAPQADADLSPGIALPDYLGGL